MLNSSDSEPESSDQEINDISIGSDSESTESNNSIKDCNCNNLECSTFDNYWKVIVEMNGLSINDLTDQQKYFWM